MPPADLSPLDLLTLAVGAALFVFLVYATAGSWREGEPRATALFALLAVVVPAPYGLVGGLGFRGEGAAALVLLAVATLGLLAWLLPLGRSLRPWDDTPTTRIDERDIMFSRRLLEPGTERFAAHYRKHPAHKAPDDAFRAEPGLLGKGASAYHPLAFPAADASFWTIERLRPHVDGAVAPERVDCDPASVTTFLRHWALKLGAVSVGVTELRDYHLYTTVGRGPDWGRPVELDHTHALALAVEMDKATLDRAPLAPTVMESAQQYVASGVIAVQLADFIRRLGYPARAHIDGHYRVICPLVARDAGLGEIGRMGLLMTPGLGPRVRLAVVTTTLPLTPDGRRRDPSVTDFCLRCRKCAVACPSGAISFGDPADIAGVTRWQIDQEACFTLWCRLGTDCARCVRVCPYSHPNTLLHNLIRTGVRRSAPFRRLAIPLDDVFYGRRPAPAALPEWMECGGGP
ncbi:MAG: 4Fe-4S dicluster domain-containing protein [Gemmatimonadota bacterium]|nr:MAG: 4Fe-4S dicluster domain-containing protein [Gemmatimonadota bacterium]